MLSTLSKAYIAYAVVGAFVAVLYVYGTGGDHMGGTLLVTLISSALVFAFIASLRPVSENDLEVPLPADAPPPTTHPVSDPGPAVRPSLFPFVVAASATLIGVGLAAGKGLIILGAILLGLGAAGWLGQSWRDHPHWTPMFGKRVGERAVGPVGYPVTALVVGAVVAFSISRLYLSISETGAVIVSVILAAVVLAGATVLALGKNVGRRLTAGFAGVALLSVLGSGVAGYASGQRSVEGHPADFAPVSIEAEGIAYKEKHIDLPEGRVQITFSNGDPAGTIHDFGIYSAAPAGTDANTFVPGKPFVAVLPIDGGHKESTVVDTQVVGLELGGHYAYRCDFHPGMKGTLTVVPAPTEQKGPKE